MACRRIRVSRKLVATNGALDESPQNDELQLLNCNCHQLSKFTKLLDWMLQPLFFFQGGKLLATTELCRADWDPTGEWDISGRSEIMGKNLASECGKIIF